MYRKMQLIPVFLLVCLLFLFVVMLGINFNVGKGFLAYPPASTWPAQDGYPALVLPYRQPLQPKIRVMI